MFAEHHCVMSKYFLITLGTVAEVGTLVTLIPQFNQWTIRLVIRKLSPTLLTAISIKLLTSRQLVEHRFQENTYITRHP